MTRDEIIQMAREATAPEWLDDLSTGWHMGLDLERFAALVAAAERQARQAAQIENEALKARIARADVELQRAVITEREACAQVCEQARSRIFPFYDKPVLDAAHNVAVNIAAAIRARGAA